MYVCLILQTLYIIYWIVPQSDFLMAFFPYNFNFNNGQGNVIWCLSLSNHKFKQVVFYTMILKYRYIKCSKVL
jgi:hypothetical protein